MIGFSRLSYLFCIVTGFTVLMCYNVVFCEIVQHESCYYTPLNSCQIVSTAIDPCPEALANETCILYKGTNITLTFTFIPKFSGDNITFQTYSHTAFMDIPYRKQDRNGCHFTKCPFVPGEQQIIKYSDIMSHKYPSAPFTLKWRLWNKDDEECCWMIPIIIA